MTWVIFILVWIFSCIISIALVYHKGKHKHIVYTVGDLIDETPYFLWVPLVNTVSLILLGMALMTVKIINLLKLSVLWEKFRNIKLK